MRFITSYKEELQPNSKIYFENTSIDLCSSLNLYIITNENISSINQEIFGDNFSFYKIVNDEVLTNINNQDIEKIDSNVYKINLLFNPNNFETSGKLVLTINNEVFEFELYGEVEELDERLVITLQNFKKFMSNDYVIAFRETEHNANSIDYELYNRKIREYLMNIHNLSTIHGSYKNLNTVIKFFGYGELLSLKEYWYNDSKYMSTPIGGKVIDYIDRSLTGYKKSNQLSLVYQINEQDGYDEDGLPTYINVLSITDEILTKLWTLQRILENEFIAINTHIVDIIGEMQSVVGIELNYTLNFAEISTHNLTDNLNTETSCKLKSNKIKILNHKVILDEFKIYNDGDDLYFIDDQFNFDFFKINRIAYKFDEFDLLTRYYNGDFGLLEYDLKFDESRYQLVMINIFNGSLLYESKKYELSDLIVDNKILFGIKNEGEYLVNIELIDYYGAKTVISSEKVNVSYNELNIYLGKFADLEKTNLENLPTNYSTFESSTGLLVPDANNNLDINIWDIVNNDPEMLIARRYENDYDLFTNYTTNNQLNTLKIAELNGIPIKAWTNSHTIIIIEINEVDGYIGFSIAYKGNEKTNVNIAYQPSLSIEQNIIHLIDYIHNIDLEILNDFDFDLHYFSHNPNASITESYPVLRLISKESGYKSRIIDIEPLSNDLYCNKNDIRVYSSKMSEILIDITSSSINEFVIKVDEIETKFDNIQINSNQELYDFLKNIEALEVYYIDNKVKIFSNFDIELSHTSFGIQKSCLKSRHLGKIKRIENCSDVQLGQPIFACIDENKHIEIKDINWTLTNALNDKIITSQKALSFMWIFKQHGVYSLNCKFEFSNKKYDFNIDGAFIVR